MNTKLHAICDRQSRPLNLFATDRQVSNYIGARALLGDLPHVQWLLGDQGYNVDWFRDAVKRTTGSRSGSLSQTDMTGARKSRSQAATIIYWSSVLTLDWLPYRPRRRTASDFPVYIRDEATATASLRLALGYWLAGRGNPYWRNFTPHVGGMTSYLTQAPPWISAESSLA